MEVFYGKIIADSAITGGGGGGGAWGLSTPCAAVMCKNFNRMKILAGLRSIKV